MVRLGLSGGTELAFITGGEVSKPAVLLLHGTPNSSRMFRYLHDWGAPVGLQIAMDAPERVLGLIVQNANAHRTGWGPGWAATRAYWSQPNAALQP